MTLLVAALLFLLVVIGMAAAGMKIWVRPKEAMDRVVGGGDANDSVPLHPSLAMHALIAKLGNFIPQSPKDVTVMQRRLIRAGIRNEGALKLLYGAKAFFGMALPVTVAFFIVPAATDPGNKFVVLLVAAGIGFFGPNEYVRRLASKRQHEIAKGLPNALDLLVVCVESGLGLDQAILQVSKELDEAHPEISEEFGFVTLEL
jgi:tight adherence protein C